MSGSLRDGFHGEPWSRSHFEATEPKVAKCLYLIEADSYASLALWMDFSDQSDDPKKGFPRIKWDSLGASGPSITIGKLDGRPIVLSMMVKEIDSIPVCFIHACSQLVDHKMVDGFLEIVMPGVPRADAGNFHHFIHSMDELKKVVALRKEMQALESVAGPGYPSTRKPL